MLDTSRKWWFWHFAISFGSKLRLFTSKPCRHIASTKLIWKQPDLRARKSLTEHWKHKCGEWRQSLSEDGSLEYFWFLLPILFCPASPHRQMFTPSYKLPVVATSVAATITCLYVFRIRQLPNIPWYHNIQIHQHRQEWKRELTIPSPCIFRVR